MNSFKLFILAADRNFFEGECESLIFPSIRGQFGVQAHHVNMISAITPGSLQFREPGSEMQTVAVSEGIIKVENNEVLVLVDSAERPEEIDANRAKRAEAAAKEELLQKKSVQEYRSAQAHLARAAARLRVRHDYDEKML